MATQKEFHDVFSTRWFISYKGKIGIDQGHVFDIFELTTQIVAFT